MLTCKFNPFLLLMLAAYGLYAKATAINPATQTVNVKVIFVSFSEGKTIPSDADSVMAQVSDFYDKMSLNRHHISSAIIRRPSSNRPYAFTSKNSRSIILSNIPDFDAKLGILQKDIFEQVYNNDSLAFKNVDFIFFVTLDTTGIGFDGMGKLGAFNAAGIPRKIYSGPGATCFWRDSFKANAWTFAHEYGHQLGLNHPPQNEMYRFYGWYELMNNSFTDQPVISPISAVQFAFNDLWLNSGELVRITANQRNTEIPPFMSTHRILFFLDTNQNAFIIANYQRENFDSIYAGTGLLIWHTQSYNVWDIEAASGNWKDGVTGSIALPNGLPEGSDLLDQPIYTHHSFVTDFFDGQTYKSFTSGTNPNTNLYPPDTSKVYPYASHYSDLTRTLPQTIPSHFAMMNLHRKALTGADSKIMVADFFVNNWSGHITQNTRWSSAIHVSGDITIDAGVTLTIAQGVTISFEPGIDDQKSGDDIARSELIVNGTLTCQGTSARKVVFTSAGVSPAANDWGGIIVNAGATATLGSYTYQYATRAITYK